MTFSNYQIKGEKHYLSEKKVTLFDHFLVPTHELMNQEEIENILTKYKIKTYQLPHIKASDPAAKAINAKLGDVIKITRKSPTAGQAVVYRYVVKG
jgi:DNA-directed RNA polymerase subunit H